MSHDVQRIHPLLLLQLPLAAVVVYLDVLAAAAALWRSAAARGSKRHRFAVLVPAHNEEVLLPRLLSSIAALDYPRDLFDVHVVADNCTDHTVHVAAGAGAIVHERREQHLQGKGYALQWLLKQVEEDGKAYDAFVIIDADSIVSTNFLDVMDRHLERGDQAMQSYYGVLNLHESSSSALRYLALALYNGVRPRGRDALQLSAGLRGNGMCFASDLLERFGWEAFALAEDVEFHLKLVEAGVRVHYAGEANVLAEMPTSLRQAQSQNVRWERGRLQMLKRFGPRLLALGVRRRDAMVLDALAEQLVPPLSVITGLASLLFLFSVAFRAPAPRRLAALLLTGQAGYVLSGLKLVRADRYVYLALLRAPVYVLWKVAVYTAAFAHIREGRWIRTARPSDTPLGGSNCADYG